MSEYIFSIDFLWKENGLLAASKEKCTVWLQIVYTKVKPVQKTKTGALISPKQRGFLQNLRLTEIFLVWGRLLENNLTCLLSERSKTAKLVYISIAEVPNLGPTPAVNTDPEARNATSWAKSDGVYMLPILRFNSRNGLVFCFHINSEALRRLRITSRSSNEETDKALNRDSYYRTAR